MRATPILLGIFCFVLALGSGLLLWSRGRSVRELSSPGPSPSASVLLESPPPSKNASPLPPSVESTQKRVFHERLATWLSASNENSLETLRLTLEEKAWVRDLYFRSPREDRRGRGALAFLLAKNARSENDFEFFPEVLTEKPCLSLQDCDRPPSARDDHHGEVVRTTLLYPQKVVLYQMERILESGSSHERQWAQEALRSGSKSAPAEIREEIRALLNR